MVPETRNCLCSHALKDAIITAPQAVPETVKRDLAPIVGKYLGISDQGSVTRDQ